MPNGQRCTAWVNNPFEAQGAHDPACPYPIPQQAPFMSPGMNPVDYRMMSDYYQYGGGHSDFFFQPSYYDSFIGPSWRYHPGVYRGYGGTTIVQYHTVNDYRTTVGTYDRVNASTITTAKANPKYSTYSGSDGKSYSGKAVPAKAFSGGDSSPAKAGGSAGVSTGYGYQSKPATSGSNSSSSSGSSSSYTGSTGKGGYSGSSGSSSSSSSGRSSSGSSSGSSSSGSRGK
jgi:hypothetical protein